MNADEFTDWILDKYSNEANEDVEQLPFYVKHIMCVLLVHYPIGNGGFRFLFEMNLSGNVSYKMVVHSFKEVGLLDVAEQFQKVIDLFPGSEPHEDMKEREVFLTSYFECEDEDGNKNTSYSGVVEYAESIYFEKFNLIPNLLFQYYQNHCSA